MAQLVAKLPAYLLAPSPGGRLLGKVHLLIPDFRERRNAEVQLRGIFLPRTTVNKGKKVLAHKRGPRLSPALPASIAA